MRLWMFGFMMAVLLATQTVSAKQTTLKVGDAAPQFKLPGHDGKTYTLEEFKGKKVVLYFYPKDETPGCTKEACAFRDRNKDMQALGAVVFGVNTDSIASHKKFVEKYNLTFPLLSDADAKVATAYGAKGALAWVKRETFIVDSKGVIAHIFRDVDVGKHGDEVLAALRNTP